MRTALASVVVTACLLCGCDHKPPQDPPPGPDEQERVKQTGHAVADKLVQTLGGQMKSALESGGPIAAITVCQSAAQPLTDSVTTSTPGTTVRRTSLKVRNPANAPDETDLKVLHQFAAFDPDHLPAEIITWTPEAARFYKPLVTQEVCTKCHGDSADFAPALRDLLRKAYPDDQATGYAIGDLRGVIRVDIDRP